ncbi:hypothetical protein NQ176_g11244 [Zarea fungicola]|uniref:Uncharacterized protein n=1 Tax=Zarea fungicola TaxID=93591 RepID=A0ACC1MBL1_9HYPO|nr:hypothetical protein NQ176_g11244 [Lecanicillium fungicola]
MLFFLFACLGNITYVLSIFAFEPKCSHEKGCKKGEAGRIYGRYMLVNLSWLAGALVTLFMDFGVFAQYFMYKKNDDSQYTTEDEEEQQHGLEGESSRANGNGHRQTDSWDQRPLLERSDSNPR